MFFSIHTFVQLKNKKIIISIFIKRLDSSIKRILLKKLCEFVFAALQRVQDLRYDTERDTSIYFQLI